MVLGPLILVVPIDASSNGPFQEDDPIHFILNTIVNHHADADAQSQFDFRMSIQCLLTHLPSSLIHYWHLFSPSVLINVVEMLAAVGNRAQVHSVDDHKSPSSCKCPCRYFFLLRKIDDARANVGISGDQGQQLGVKYLIKRVVMKNYMGCERRRAMREGTYNMERIMNPISVFPMVYKIDICKRDGDYCELYARLFLSSHCALRCRIDALNLDRVS